jgi:P2-related tail formation protein
MKRAAVEGSIPWHRKKGTRWAVKKALEMIGVDAEIVEWWDIPNAIPHTFGIRARITDDYYLNNPDWPKTTQSIRRAVEESKPVRSWLVDLKTIIQETVRQDIYHGVATLRGGMQKIRPVLPSVGDTKITSGIGTAQGGSVRVCLARPELRPASRICGIAVMKTGFITINPA